MPQNTDVCSGLDRLLIDRLRFTMWSRLPSLSADTDLFFSPTLNLQAQKASDSPRRKRKGRRPICFTGSASAGLGFSRPLYRYPSTSLRRGNLTYKVSPLRYASVEMTDLWRV